ncbi:MAG: hypothetical protein ABJL67_15890 [Sulfitobacter sp.]
MSMFSGDFSAGDQKRFSFIFGVLAIAFVLVVLVLTFWMKMHEVQKVWALVEFFMRTVIALCAGGIASCLPGFLDLDWRERSGIRAGGAVGVFVLVFLVNPPNLMAEAASSREVTTTYDFCKEGIKFDKDMGEDVISICEGMEAAFPDHHLTELVQAKLALVRGEESAAYHIARAAMILSIRNAGDPPVNPELQYEVKAVLHTMHNVANAYPSPAWARAIQDNLRKEVGLQPEQKSRVSEVFDTLFNLNNTAAWLKKELEGIEAMADEGDQLFKAKNANRSKPLFVSFCARSWSDFMHNRAVRSDLYQGKMDAIFQELDRQTGTQGTKRRITCLNSNQVCENYALAVQWCPGLNWVELPI